MKPINQLIEQLKAEDQDHEFYPTTDAIISRLAFEIGLVETNEHGNRHRGSTYTSLLDIGAGHGKVLNALKQKCGFTELFAIEKSSILCQQLPEDVLVIGTEFHEQSLMSKPVDVVYCNPPYREYEAWAVRLIRECAANVLFLCIPRRWKDSVAIADALKYRAVSAITVGEFDFEDAEDRTARAKVHLLRIGMGADKEDAFDRWFNEQFADVINKFNTEDAPRCKDCHTELTDENKRASKRNGKADYYICPQCYTSNDHHEAMQNGGRNRPFHSLVIGPNYPEALVNLYNGEMAHIQKNYQALGALDVDLMREFEIFPAKVLAALKQRMKGLKNDYWMELFSHLDTITNRLTSTSRKELLNVLHKHVSVDFTVSNIVEVVLWVIKNANTYIDRQLINTYRRMAEKANVVNYKSNQRVFTYDDWRYLQSWNHDRPVEKPKRFALDYRIVLAHLGGCAPRYGTVELAESAAEFMGDLLTIANNLGFRNDAKDRYALLGYHERRNWRPGQKEEFFFVNPKKRNAGGMLGCRELLFDVRAFQNGNSHFRMNPDFMLALNVEHGRLEGWLRSAQEAAEELKDPKAAQYFNTNLRLTAGNATPMLAAPAPEPEPEPGGASVLASLPPNPQSAIGNRKSADLFEFAA